MVLIAELNEIQIPFDLNFSKPNYKIIGFTLGIQVCFISNVLINFIQNTIAYTDIGEGAQPVGPSDFAGRVF